MTKASEYKVAFGSGINVEEAINALQLDVNALITVGWQPIGGVSALADPDPQLNAELCLIGQAMILQL